VETKTGEIARRVSFVKDVAVQRWTEAGFETVTESFKEGKRCITQQSNLRVGDYHYFRAYTRNYLGRIHIKSGDVEYLELPLQILREPGEKEQILWNAEHRPDDLAKHPGKKKQNALSYIAFRFNNVTNSRGVKVMGDDRAIQNGWGHTASPLPTAIGGRLYVPILSGLVFVIQADAKVFNEEAIVAMNDLGPLGDAFNRSSLTTDGLRIYAHTIKEVIAIGKE
ncbi:MAG: hypothetical protein AAF585_25985, partial [Verrucomicrobiota bacterium]